MPEVAYKNQTENDSRTRQESQMLEDVDNFNIKQLGSNFINYFSYDDLGFSTRYKNKGEKLDDAFLDDFNFAQRISNRFKYHLNNDYGFNSEIDFKSFKIVSGLKNKVYNINGNGCEDFCFGTGMKVKNSDPDIVMIKYSQAVKDEPKHIFEGKEYGCQEMFEVSKEEKGKTLKKIILRKYYVGERQIIDYQFLAEVGKDLKKNLENYSKINI